MKTARGPPGKFALFWFASWTVRAICAAVRYLVTPTLVDGVAAVVQRLRDAVVDGVRTAQQRLEGAFERAGVRVGGVTGVRCEPCGRWPGSVGNSSVVTVPNSQTGRSHPRPSGAGRAPSAPRRA
jgi:hypothetical protein